MAHEDRARASSVLMFVRAAGVGEKRVGCWNENKQMASYLQQPVRSRVTLGPVHDK